MALVKKENYEDNAVTTPSGGVEESLTIDPEEMAAAEEAAKTAEDIVHYDLSRPIDYAGKHYEYFDLDFEKLTGKDCLTIEREVEVTTGKNVVVPALNSEYLVRFVAHASADPVGADVIYALKAKDFMAITGKARSFLLASGS